MVTIFNYIIISHIYYNSIWIVVAYTMLCRPSYSLWRHSLKACGSLGKRLASGSIPGFASTDGTMAFVHQAELPMYHVFEKHKLYVNPIIHGPPKKVSGKNIRSDEALEEAVLKNRSNAVYVYRYSPKTDKGPSTWHSPMLNKLITGNGLPRECIVTIADLGIVDSLSEISRRLKEALSLTNLEHIDCVVVQVNIVESELLSFFLIDILLTYHKYHQVACCRIHVRV